MHNILLEHYEILAKLKYQKELCNHSSTLYSYNELERLVYELEKSTQLIHKHVVEAKIEVIQKLLHNSLGTAQC